jgi:hypothetical protein
MESLHMFQMFAIRLRYSSRCIFVLILLCALPMRGPRAQEEVRHLYLLAATTTKHSDKTYPATLYQVNSGTHLKSVREVVTQPEGVRFVRAWEDTIFVIHPNQMATTASIIHGSDPLRADNIVFNPAGMFVDDLRTVITQPVANIMDILFPILTDKSDPNHLKGRLLSVSGTLREPAQRIRYDQWKEYENLRMEGDYGDPAYDTRFIGSAEGDNLSISCFGYLTVIDTLPPATRNIRDRAAGLFAASARYMVLSVLPRLSTEKMSSANRGDSLQMWVHDLKQDSWHTIRIEGNSSRLRLFDPWLTVIVGTSNPDHKPSPGRENERNHETERLPNVQYEYSRFAGKWIWSPGVLVLQNLADGREIRIETGQEDSQVLSVEGDTLLYRINDTIYQARIVGDQLKDAAVVVKDEDVPEIHWVFWSK